MTTQPERIPLGDLTHDQLDALYADLDRYEEVQGDMNERAVDLARRVAELEQQVEQQISAKVSVAGQWGNALADKAAAEKRIAELEAEAVEHLAAHEQETANTAREIDRALAAEARVAELEQQIAAMVVEQEKSDAITAEVDAKTEEQLNGATQVVQHYKALAERTQLWGEQESARANRYRDRVDRAKAECDVLDRDVHGLNEYALASRRDAVSRIRAALKSVHPLVDDTAAPRPREERVAELAETLCLNYTYGVSLAETEHNDPAEAEQHREVAGVLLRWMDEAPARELKAAFMRGHDRGRAAKRR